MIVFLMGLWLGGEGSGLIWLRNFENPTSEFLAAPHFMDFSPQGDLFVLDKQSVKIFRWDAEGRFVGSFGKEGDGPGELIAPILVGAGEKEIWVCDSRRRVTVFDHEGNFSASFLSPSNRVRRMAVLGEDLWLAGYLTRRQAEKDLAMVFEVLNRKGESVRQIYEKRNEAFLSTMEGKDDVTLKAFGPEIDIHSDKRSGGAWFGFSQEPVIFRVSSEGEIVEKKALHIPTQPPTESEREAFAKWRVLGPEGTVVTLDDLPDLKLSFSHDKAYYTHFLIRKGKLAAVLTPISGNDVQKGYHQGWYYVLDFENGDVLSRGEFELAEDSQVIFNSGRAVAFELGENDEYRISEVSLEGM